MVGTVSGGYRERNERKRAEREENRSERGRDGQKADRSLRYGRGSVCYATPPDLNVDQIILMMPEGDKGKTDRRDTEFCGEGLVGDGSRCAYYGIRRVQTVGPCATHGKETVGLVCTDGTRRFWNARRLRSRGVCTDDADQTARVIWAVIGCIVLERDTGGALSMASVLSILDGWLETKPSLIVYLDHVGMHRSACPFCRQYAPGLNWPGRASGAVTLKKLECSKQAYTLYTLAWDNIIGFLSYCAGLQDRTFAKDVFINQERKLGARRRSDTVLVSTINDADQGSADVAFRTPLAPYEKSKFLGSGGSMVARLKLKGIDGRAPPGVEPAA
uniref:Uncharacterized protein n=1 Tax=Brassica oleracea var. oleracea TaxID=109376 RepID=A0A0D2ZQ67_BRAOL